MACRQETMNVVVIGEEMKFVSSYCTDVGISKKVNQDSLCIKVARTLKGDIAMVVVCDGMGGLAKGELASATVIRAFNEWFTQTLPGFVNVQKENQIENSWEKIVHSLNERLWAYGIKENAQLGTTLTALLVFYDGTYKIIHVGDSRAYKVTNQEIIQLTEDQSFVAREVRRGNMTKEQAAVDPRKNVLLQCIGASRDIEAQLINGTAGSGDIFLLCSDGLRHKVPDKEMFQIITDADIQDSAGIDIVLNKLIEMNKDRGEKDNISAVLLKLI